MTPKPVKSNRKFIPISISDSLKDVNKKLLYKFGKLDYFIHSKWGEIVGEFFVNYSEPVKINLIQSSENDFGDKVYDRYLHVNVSPSAAIEFQHFQDKIIEKINSYFGYEAIKGIKIHQHFVRNVKIKSKNKGVNLIKQKSDSIEVRKSAPKLNNKELEESIVKLGLSIKNEE
tara:strand:- start:327 stop:845 length:519 start_codon:yes stop_codon:yes gene_type:complete